MEEKQKRLLGFGCVIAASIINGMLPAITQKAFQAGLAVETVLFCRFLLGTVFLWALILIRKKDFRVGSKNILTLLGLGCLLFIATSFMTESYRYLAGAIASLLVFLYPGIVVVIEILMGREKAQKSRIICLVLAVMGLIAVVWTPEGGVKLSALGILLAVFAALFYAVQTIGIGAKRLSAIGTEVMTGYMMLPLLLCNTIRCLLSGQPFFPKDTATGWICVLFLGVFVAFIAPMCFTQAVKSIGASDASLVNTLEPVVAYFGGIVIMSDRISWNATLGGAIIVCAILLLNYSKRKAAVREDELR